MTSTVSRDNLQVTLLRRSRAAARLSLTGNVFLVVLKVTAGVLSGSVSVLAEGLQSTVDVAASALILFTVCAAARPPDARHPYGHGKFEPLAALAQALLILGSSVGLLSVAWERWQHPAVPRVDWGIGALLVSAGVNLVVSRRVTTVARETGSPALAAEAAHLRGDLLACAGVVMGLVLVRITGQPRLDPLIAGVMVLFVLREAVRLARVALGPLLDEQLPPEDLHCIRRVLEGHAEVRAYHRLRGRTAGARRLVDVHVLLDDTLPFPVAHDLVEEIEDEVRRTFPDVDITIHAEPYEAEMRHQMQYHRDEPLPGPAPPAAPPSET